MTQSFDRRDFIKSTSLLGVSAAVAGHSGPRHAAAKVYTAKGKFFSLSFDSESGTFDLRRRDGSALLTRATSCVNFDGGQTDPTSRRLVSGGGFQHTARVAKFADRLGRGVRLTVHCKDSRKLTDVDIHVSLYEDLQAFTVETSCTNVSSADIAVRSIEPVRVIKDSGGVLHVPEVVKCLTNGEMYYDTGSVHTFGSSKDAITSGELKGVSLANGPIGDDKETIHSWWNAGLFSGDGRPGIALGYLENKRCLGNLLTSRVADGEISFVAESVYPPRLILKPGKSISSTPLWIGTAENTYRALELYATAVGKTNDARVGSVLNGWCSWFYTLARVSADEVVENAEFAAKHLKPYGLEYIQVDEGFQRWHGDWEGNERFPKGMKWLADQIKSYGFKAGIWIAPYVVSEPTALFKEHPDWLLHRRDGSLQRVGNWPAGAEPPADENPKRYCLDITHPQAAQWLHRLIDTIVNDWGYELIKIDFVAWSILAAEQYHDPTLSAAAVYRMGMEIMRRAAGDKCHILECGPGAITTGLIDSMRIEADVNYGYHETAWETYFTHPASSAAAAARRWYFHGRTWVNDVDHLCVDLLTIPQCQAAATLIALSGGNMVSGDRLTQLDRGKLDILKKITPSLGQAAIPVDLFGDDAQNAFVLHVDRPFARWTILAVFNPDLANAARKKFPLEKLGLKAAATYVAFDFWKQQLAGEVSRELEVTVQPGGVTLLALHQRSGKPQVVSTDRHVSQGALEIVELAWDEGTRTLSGTSRGPLHTSHNVFVYVPDALDWTWEGSALYRDHDSHSLKLVGRHLVRVHVRFEASDRVRWQVRREEFLAQPR
jgi:hypothetical protein